MFYIKLMNIYWVLHGVATPLIVYLDKRTTISLLFN